MKGSLFEFLPVIANLPFKGTYRPEKLVFSIQLIHEEGQWQVIRETAFVQPIK
ncbi:hypothetical protein LQ318_13495 [Aliifodinibius salicampi]|uniref:Uncharacterized protein n=1 Tax=Fodinibius salicampi TaxID=1920655 RepID=A0ABT3Q1D3_9BACT|nr:hypothetical protein [Fodinibius salicampi]MCW9713920.1 hypothetical protein [Fodinibius salicampi]